MSAITINGIDLELDMLDADILEKYQSLNQEIVDKIQEPAQYEKLSTPDAMRKQCRYVDEYFDKLFGEGTAERIFHGGNNLGIRLEAFGQVTSMAMDANRQVQRLTDKYAPRPVNREQRRAQQHGKKLKNYAVANGGRKP